MLIFADGSIHGTIGGGKLEAMVMDAARDVIGAGSPKIMDFEFSGPDAASLDMICGGSAKILLEPVVPGAGSSLWLALDAIRAAREEHGHAGWLVSSLKDDAIQHAYYDLLPAILYPAVEGNKIPNQPTGSFLKTQDDGLLFADPLVSPARVIIFGAGHVSRALASVAKIAGFHTVVLDDRSEFANRQRFPDCDEVLVMDPITRIFQQQPFVREDMIVIVTRGHLQDQTVLETALKTKAGYIGMIGSKRKRELLYRGLREKGVAEEQLLRVHSPIGINIGAETPEEIAVSITAELIQQKVLLQRV